MDLHNAPDRALCPVETEPGVLVHSSADRRLAAEHWLLSTHPNPGQARKEWRLEGLALLPLGTLFSAVLIPEGLVHAAAGTEDPAAVDAFLAEALLGGPIICDPRYCRYYALVPASTATTWPRASKPGVAAGVECLGRESYLGVPRLDAVIPQPLASYWSVPMSSAAMLCEPIAVARLIAAGRHQLAEGPDA